MRLRRRSHRAPVVSHHPVVENFDIPEVGEHRRPFRGLTFARPVVGEVESMACGSISEIYVIDVGSEVFDREPFRSLGRLGVVLLGKERLYDLVVGWCWWLHVLRISLISEPLVFLSQLFDLVP
ncbi:MAG: hypothetical protein J07HQW2_01566 [Haloquadratum walsbyi J07HQW2]|uniref:Uncharacterized protein n=1 Tax=Haloquadratum walsbyi J07HQW2 TaxID=1238425 RepID=U1NDP3_9EURY|nr:MAG: hypothetical protein J07HQW2_01566 [Haloquadratum walsbyi J07HQW2]